ncbi:uncharacterized protein K452DRAFT_284197 [Aplosporella prunicola CBS 121167]|uniref:TRAM domain-containing protein n=1 Tax=Aplosporella prunicola CBS 121167 TaxID=1176127 RepID=A0A6A6BR85_9PEZI|nr:uncharacterized protein K452DRAFT_284197 [Aplosporella prunicola CBS 121167]KAF2145815.1 hypothetical protein K452DRAFT_284197 [Aplosporella prunicola CBS 121167]
MISAAARRIAAAATTSTTTHSRTYAMASSAPKRAYEDGRSYRFKKQQKKEQVAGKPDGTHEEVLLKDITALLQKHSLNEQSEVEEKLPEPFSEIDVTVDEISSTGDGLARLPGSRQIYVVPFTAPGDKVKAKVIRHFPKNGYTTADFVSVVEPSPQRDDSLIRCPYFASCSGCQFQMLPYAAQLAHKKTIVEKAYKNFSDLPPELVPAVGETIGSPLQYGYRTKLTPHFDGPPGMKRSDGRNGIKRHFEAVPPIGFMKKGTRHTMDIEDCPIGTDAVRMGMKRERARVAAELGRYTKGATLLLRESTKRLPKDPAPAPRDDAILEDRGTHFHEKTCVTDPNGTTTEFIDDYQFSNPAGAFFQNNNSILSPFTQYVRSHILPPSPTTTTTATPTAPSQNTTPIQHLIDAYSGSGLFTITLSPLFPSSLGIDISATSIASASQNAALNALSPTHASFLAADAAHLFASITSPAAETAVVIDPPRKGCDDSFLRQLLRYSPARVLYVSCNVHTQARDVGVLVSGMKGVDAGFGVGEGAYEIESVRGFDFFPQTGHVEGVAVLRRREEGAVKGVEVEVEVEKEADAAAQLVPEVQKEA